MKTQILFATGFALFGLIACQHNPTTDLTTKNAQILETVGNIDAFPSSEGNQAKLFKTNDNCQIEFTAFYETGKATEYWSFKGNQLYSGRTIISHYANGGLSNPENSPSDIKVDQSKENVFDIQNEATQTNFRNLQAQFSKANLEQCQVKFNA